MLQELRDPPKSGVNDRSLPSKWESVFSELKRKLKTQYKVFFEESFPWSVGYDGKKLSHSTDELTRSETAGRTVVILEGLSQFLELNDKEKKTLQGHLKTQLKTVADSSHSLFRVHLFSSNEWHSSSDKGMGAHYFVPNSFYTLNAIQSQKSSAKPKDQENLKKMENQITYALMSLYDAPRKKFTGNQLASDSSYSWTNLLIGLTLSNTVQQCP